MTTPSLPHVVIAAVDVSVDSDLAIAAHIVDVAAAWAHRLGAHCAILTACPPPPIPSLGPLDPQNVSVVAMRQMLDAMGLQTNERLTQLAERAHKMGVVATVHTLTEPGRLPDLLAQAAVTIAGGDGRGLLVLSSRGRKGLGRLLGSVAERTAHLSRVPVLLLPPD
jgi:nucleotide-binding universal stress UspA family protein